MSYSSFIFAFTILNSFITETFTLFQAVAILFILTTIVKEKGISVHGETLPMKLGVRNHGYFVHKGFIELTAKQLAAVNDFVKKVIDGFA